MAHTPGPWAIEAAPPTSSGLAVLSGNGAIVAVCKHLPAPEMIGSECEDNAALIAAAPAMLAALQELVAWHENPNAPDCSVWLGEVLACHVRPAIAAATGER